jgi:hypothetical protein
VARLDQPNHALTLEAPTLIRSFGCIPFRNGLRIMSSENLKNAPQSGNESGREGLTVPHWGASFTRCVHFRISMFLLFNNCDAHRKASALSGETFQRSFDKEPE